MPQIDEGTFHLYGAGLRPEKVFLGHLLLGSYKTPTRVKQYSFPRLSDDELKSWAEIRDWTGKIGVNKTKKYGVQGVVFAVGEVGPGFSTDSDRTIVAEKGRRIELKSPTDFFVQKVLGNQEARDHLQMWVSVTRSRYLQVAMGMRRPKIWILTGLLELEDAKCCVIQKKDSGFKVTVDPAVLAGLCGAPIGFSVNLDSGTTVTVDSQVSGRLVWAAQYQQVEARYLVGAGNANVPPNWFQLHPDSTYSTGVVLGDVEEPDIAELKIQDIWESELPNEDLDEKYWDAFERAEKKMREDLEDI